MRNWPEVKANLYIAEDIVLPGVSGVLLFGNLSDHIHYPEIRKLYVVKAVPDEYHATVL